MAKKKDQTIEAEVVLEEIEELKEESAIEDVTETKDDVVSEKTTDAVVEESELGQFIDTQLKLINRLNNPAKQRRLADRVLRNRKR